MMQQIFTLNLAIVAIVPVRCTQVQRGNEAPLSFHSRVRYTADVDEIVYAYRGVDRARLADLNRRSDARGLRHLAGHAALLLATAR